METVVELAAGVWGSSLEEMLSERSAQEKRKAWRHVVV